MIICLIWVSGIQGCVWLLTCSIGGRSLDVSICLQRISAQYVMDQSVGDVGTYLTYTPTYTSTYTYVTLNVYFDVYLRIRSGSLYIL